LKMVDPKSCSLSTSRRRRVEHRIDAGQRAELGQERLEWRRRRGTGRSERRQHCQARRAIRPDVHFGGRLVAVVVHGMPAHRHRRRVHWAGGNRLAVPAERRQQRGNCDQNRQRMTDAGHALLVAGAGDARQPAIVEAASLFRRDRLGGGLGRFVGVAHADRARSAVGERFPRFLRTPATLTHMGERCRVRLGPGLSGPGEVEIEVRRVTHEAYSASPASSSLALASAGAPSSASRMFTAAILPRRSASRS